MTRSIFPSAFNPPPPNYSFVLVLTSPAATILPSGWISVAQPRSWELVREVVTMPGALPVGLNVGSSAPAESRQRPSSTSTRGREAGRRKAGRRRGAGRGGALPDKASHRLMSVGHIVGVSSLGAVREDAKATPRARRPGARAQDGR